ncbi:Hypothetical predicted protein [Podarcis lilfordi]|uniref:Uncharacterized protein n=1 Tax=Podarcis lilfordi TaxID=74358 RepID=A0AA35LDB2_9SAUR|nr:Hypothetical predicted protein [Podarcis lilfordi]
MAAEQREGSSPHTHEAVVVGTPKATVKGTPNNAIKAANRIKKRALSSGKKVPPMKLIITKKKVRDDHFDGPSTSDGRPYRAHPKKKKRVSPGQLAAESDASQSSGDDVQELLRQNRSLQRRLARVEERLDRSKSPCRRSCEGTCDSCGESEERCKGYWVTTHKASGLPSWIWERRTRRHRCAFGAREPCGEDGLDAKGRVRASNFKHTDQPPGIQLKKNLRNRILNGEFVDMFSLLSPASFCSSKFKPESYCKRDKAVDVARTFDNWLTVYTTYMGLVAAAYPDKAWHLANYQGIILKARKMAGDSAALAYDGKFRERAAEDPKARWDIKDSDIWSEVVAPHFEKRALGEKAWDTFGHFRGSIARHASEEEVLQFLVS